MKISRTVVGVDTAKRVFQLYWVDMETGEIVDLRLTRTKFLERLCCKPDVGVSQIRTTTVLTSCFCVGQTVL